jgi:phage terminase large subunit-like protein
MTAKASFAGTLADALETSWPARARPNQLPPAGDNWNVWLLLAGRGYGKTRVLSEWANSQAISGRTSRLAIVGATAADVRDIMIEGESGILPCAPPWARPNYESSRRRLLWPNGAIATLYSAEEPDRLRGPQHDAAVCDELGSWPHETACWDMLQFGLRLGVRPRCVVATTPRPTKLIRRLIADPDCIVTRGSSYENRANLAPAFFDSIVRRYEGTRLGRQELDGEVLEDVEGALWTRDQLERCRRERAPAELVRVVVAIDPAATSGEDADETGIIVAGKDVAGHGYVIADVSGHYAPTEWARIAIAAYREHCADRIVAEVNNGGEMVEATLRVVDPNVSYSAVRATRGKITRAEPVHGHPGLREAERRLARRGEELERASAAFRGCRSSGGRYDSTDTRSRYPDSSSRRGRSRRSRSALSRGWPPATNPRIGQDGHCIILQVETRYY